MTKTEFIKRLRHAIDTHSMEAMIREADSVMVLYQTAETFGAQVGRDVASLVGAFDFTDVRVTSLDAGAWNRPEMPRYRLIVTFEGAE